MRKLALAVSFALLSYALPAMAHHAFASVFDHNRYTTITGTLAKIEWINPHAYFYVDVKDSKGKVETWALESFSPGTLRKAGFIRKDMVARIGQPMKISLFRARDNTKTLGWADIFEFADGTKLQLSRDLVAKDDKF